MSDDPVRGLVHDHEHLNRQVLAIGAALRTLQRTGGTARELVDRLGELREHLFLHFAREEEGVFPFVAEALPELGDQVHAMAQTHDAICGALVRMIHLAATDAELASIATIYERFEKAYVAHAKTEAELLDSLAQRLDAEQLAALAALVAGL